MAPRDLARRAGRKDMPKLRVGELVDAAGRADRPRRAALFLWLPETANAVSPSRLGADR